MLAIAVELVTSREYSPIIIPSHYSNLFCGIMFFLDLMVYRFIFIIRMVALLWLNCSVTCKSGNSFLWSEGSPIPTHLLDEVHLPMPAFQPQIGSSRIEAGEMGKSKTGEVCLPGTHESGVGSLQLSIKLSFFFVCLGFCLDDSFLSYEIISTSKIYSKTLDCE